MEEDLLDDSMLAQLKLDERKGVKKLVSLYEKREEESKSVMNNS